MSFTSPRFLVTGASGFIGDSLCRHLSAMHPVLGLVRRPQDSCYATSVIPELSHSCLASVFQKFKPDIVVHCAGLAHRSLAWQKNNSRLYFEINVDLSTRLAAIARSSGVKRFVYLSTLGVHDTTSSGSSPISEESTVSLDSPYSASKYEAEVQLARIFTCDSSSLTVMRPALVYGHGMPGNMSKLIRAIDLFAPFPLAAVHNLRSLVSITTLVSAIEAASVHPLAGGQTYLISDSELVSTPSLIRAIARARNKPCLLFPVPLELLSALRLLPVLGPIVSQLCSDLVVDSSKIRSHLGWSQPISQSMAMAEFFARSDFRRILCG